MTEVISFKNAVYSEKGAVIRLLSQPYFIGKKECVFYSETEVGPVTKRLYDELGVFNEQTSNHFKFSSRKPGISGIFRNQKVTCCSFD
ncbi:hypothetical protein EfmAA96_13160 [Enterococcus faecium]|nr:hypothetical protein EfmAA96_13160 [Enterococcus faecium]